MIYFDDIRPAMSVMDDAHFGKLIRAIVEYAESDTEPNLDGMESLAFEMLRPKINRDSMKYEDKRIHGQYMAYCRKMKESGKEEQIIPEDEWRLLLVTDSNSTLPTTSVSVPVSVSESVSVSASAKDSASGTTTGKGAEGGIRGTEGENPLPEDEHDYFMQLSPQQKADYIRGGSSRG